jgi:outer membrane immunogenic protein
MNCAFLKAARVPLAAAFAFTALPALAADLYGSGFGSKDGNVYEMPPVWSGFYLGLNGGYAWEATASALSATAAANGGAPGTASGNYWTDGGFGGVQFGYNLQRDRLVFGIETDIQAAGIGGKTALGAVSADQSVDTSAVAKSNLDWFGTLRGRAGYAFGSTLVYATGGFAYGGVRDSLALSATSIHGTAAGQVSKDITAAGYTVGAGVETAMSPSWSVKAEYQYIDLGTSSLSTSTGIPDSTDTGGASASFDHSYHTMRVGVNYKFSQTYEPLK